MTLTEWGTGRDLPELPSGAVYPGSTVLPVLHVHGCELLLALDQREAVGGSGHGMT